MEKYNFEYLVEQLIKNSQYISTKTKCKFIECETLQYVHM